MNFVKICPTCNKSIEKTPLIDIVVTYREDLTQFEIYEQGWHKGCYPSEPMMLAACEMALEDLEQYEYTDLPGGYAVIKTVQMLRAAIAAAKGESGNA